MLLLIKSEVNTHLRLKVAKSANQNTRKSKKYNKNISHYKGS